MSSGKGNFKGVKLTSAETIKLVDYLRANQKMFIEKKMDARTIAAVAGPALGIRVLSDTTVRSKAELAGVTIPRKPKAGVFGVASKRVDALIRAVHGLYSKFGEPLPGDFASVVADLAAKDNQ